MKIHCELNTWWRRHCNGKRYFLRQIHQPFGRDMVWIYEENSNRCYHLPLTTLLKRYSPIETGPCDPNTGRAIQNMKGN